LLFSTILNSRLQDGLASKAEEWIARRLGRRLGFVRGWNSNKLR
jgi:hypothetical protein